MFCTNCGTQFEGNFCPNCGAAASPSPQVSSPPLEDQGHEIKMCQNCGDRLLPGAVKCPTCGSKDLLLLNSNEREKIQEIIANAPNQKSELTPQWRKTIKPSAKQKKSSFARLYEEALATQETIRENKEKGIACCPKCGSTSLSAGKKGFSLGKAAVGAALTGGSIGYGLIAGSLGSGKTVITCLNCGHQWKA